MMMIIMSIIIIMIVIRIIIGLFCDFQEYAPASADFCRPALPNLI